MRSAATTKTTTPKGYITGIASEYLILSMLYRLGIEAYMSLGNKKAVDIRVVKRTGEILSIDVKSVQGYSSLVVNNVVPKADHIVIFVIYKNHFQDLTTNPDIYVVPSVDVGRLKSTFSVRKE